MSHSSSNLETLLRDACRRALGLGLSFTNQLRLYRSILALVREVRLRSGGTMPDALLMQRIVVQMSRAVRLAEVSEPIERAFLAHHAMHREKPAPPKAAKPPTAEILPQHPMHRETEADDDRLSAWRKDHTTDRDQRAHEQLRTVIDERVIAKIKAMNRRDREEREAAERMAAA